MKNKKHSTFSNVWFALKIHFGAAPLFTCYRFCFIILGEIITLFEHIFFPAYVISCVEKGYGFANILYFLIPIAISASLKVTLDPWMNAYVGPKAEAKIKKALHLKLYEKAVSMEIAKYDDTEYYNDFVWAMQKAPQYTQYAVDAVQTLISQIVLVIISGSFIISTDSVAFAVVAAVLIITFTAQNIFNKISVKCEEEKVPVERKMNYTNRVFYLADFVKDMRSGEMPEKFQRDFNETTLKTKDIIKKYGTKSALVWIIRNLSTTVIYEGGYLTYLFYQALVNEKFTLGELWGLYRSANVLKNRLRQFIMMIPQFKKHSIYIEKIRSFMETENEMPDNGTKQAPKNGDIVLDNVCFTYKGNESATIKGVSMRISKGDKIALVGFNGAGKSTLIKLLLRLYDPDSGEISFDGENIKEYPLTEYRKRFGALFQDFEIIATDIGHNINMSDDALDTDTADEALKKAAFWERFLALPQGYDTQLTKEFDENGVNLSGGEAQKIALARVLYSNTDIIVLDEPSSALDPIAEYQLNKTVTELAKDKTVIIISHRLSTTRFVDKIYMLEDGRIIEEGCHDALIAKNGKYAEMFRLQAEKYLI